MQEPNTVAASQIELKYQGSLFLKLNIPYLIQYVAIPFMNIIFNESNKLPRKNIHFHMIMSDSVYIFNESEKLQGKSIRFLKIMSDNVLKDEGKY